MDLICSLSSSSEIFTMIGMTVAGFLCGLGVNLERIARIARWKAGLESAHARTDPSR